ncbi:MAG: S53 family peptidase [Acidobacteriota bacterium]|jgi:subtilase family serine protease
MKPSTYRMLFLLSAVLLMVGQLSLARQHAAVPPAQATPAQTAAFAMAIGQPLPVVPAYAVPNGVNRPHIWVDAFLGTPAIQSSPWSLCDKPYGSGFMFCPKSIQAAYGLSQIIGGNGGLGMTIAIVDAFHYDGAEADFGVFNTNAGLPDCTTANGCFKQVAQDGGPPRAIGDAGWEIETMLDIEYAHAMAPNAKILLVEGDDNSFANLFTAVQYAAGPGHADIVSNSYGASEGGQYPVGASDEFYYDSLYAPLGKPLLFSSGDNGAPTEYPCASPFATCVGGTTLTVNGSFQRTAETGWTGSGGGFSAHEPQPGYQATFPALTGNTYRATPDIAADANPKTGVLVYDSGNGGYYHVGGTSLACPLTAGLFADIDTARKSFGKDKFTFLNNSLYRGATSNYPYFYFDVSSGNNGFPAGSGFDLVTGLGVSKAAAMANRFFGLIFQITP